MSTLLLALTGFLTVAYLITRKMFGHDPREPPLAPQSIPIIGHMMGLSRSKFSYYVDLRYGLPATVYMASCTRLTTSQPAIGLSDLYYVSPGPEDVRGNEARAHSDGVEAAQDSGLSAYRGQVLVQGLWSDPRLSWRRTRMATRATSVSPWSPTLRCEPR